MATPGSFDGAFQFCRAAFRGISGGDGGGWSTDYPDADLNLSTRLGELTKTPISVDKRTNQPNHLIVPVSHPLFKDLPLDHTIFHQVVTVSKIPQIPRSTTGCGVAATHRNGVPTAGRRTSAASRTNAGGSWC